MFRWVVGLCVSVCVCICVCLCVCVDRVSWLHFEEEGMLGKSYSLHSVGFYLPTYLPT